MSEIAERNSTISSHMDGNKCNLKMHVRNLLSPPPTNQDPKNIFWRILQLNRHFNGLGAYIFGTKHKRASALQTTRSLLQRLKTT